MRFLCAAPLHTQDNLSYSVLRPVAEWEETVTTPLRECALCLEAVHARRLVEDRYVSCGRASGAFTLLAIRIHNPMLGRLLNATDKVRRDAGDGLVKWDRAACSRSNTYGGVFGHIRSG